jgi:hypothetical protein
MSLSRITMALSVYLLLSLPGEAKCAEGDHALMLSTGWHSQALANHPEAQLFDLIIGYEWGFSDYWNLTAEVGGAGGVGWTRAEWGIASEGHVGLRITTLIDALEFIPYMTAGLRAGVINNDIAPLAAYGEIIAGAGLDYRPKRAWALGILGLGTWNISQEGLGEGMGFAAVLTFKAYMPYFFD